MSAQAWRVREALRQAQGERISWSAPTAGWGSRRCDGAGGGGAPRLAPLDTGFRRYDDGDVRANKCCWWRRGEGPAAAGRALREAPLRCVGGVGDATGVGGGDAPPLAPLDTGFRRYDDGDGRVGQCWWLWRGEGPAAAGRALRETPLRRVGGVGDVTGVGGGDAPPLAPLDTGFRRYDDGDERVGKCWWLWRGEGPAAAGRALRETPLRRVGGVGDATGVGGGVAPPLAPLDTGFRRYDDVGVRANKCCWWRRGESPAAAGRALREAPLRRGVGRGCGGVWWWGALRQAQGERNRGARGRRGVGRGRRRCGEGYASGRGIQRALKSWG